MVFLASTLFFYFFYFSFFYFWSFSVFPTIRECFFFLFFNIVKLMLQAISSLQQFFYLSKKTKNDTLIVRNLHKYLVSKMESEQQSVVSIFSCLRQKFCNPSSARHLIEFFFCNASCNNQQRPVHRHCNQNRKQSRPSVA